jgi:sugar phosphate permease
MQLDIRAPIGLLFSILGALLATYGALGDRAMYARSLGININLIWGIVLLVFGLIMLWLGRRRPLERGTPNRGTTADPHPDGADSRVRAP